MAHQTSYDLARELDALEVQHALANAHRPEQVRRVGPGYAVFLGADVSLSRVYGLGFGPGDEAHLEAGEAFLTTHGAQPRVDAASHIEPAFLQALGERGYRLTRMMNVFVRDLDSPLPGPADGLPRVREVDPPTWLGVLPDETPPAILRVVAGRRDTSFWAAEQGGAWMANGALSVLGGWGILFAAMTRPEHRQRGAQTALLWVRLNAARAAGARHATVQALPGSASERNVLRAGFSLVMTRLLFGR